MKMPNSNDLPCMLSFDVEDWFQVLNMARVVDRSQWEQYELRCRDSTRVTQSSAGACQVIVSPETSGAGAETRLDRRTGGRPGS